MAKSALARRSAPKSHHPRRHSRGRRLARVAGRKMAKHGKAQVGARMGSLVGIGACAALGYAERTGKVPSLGGFEPSLVLGIGLGFVVPMLVKGKFGRMSAEAGAALSGVAAYKLAAGAPARVGFDDEVSGNGYEVGGDDEVGYEVSGEDD